MDTPYSQRLTRLRQAMTEADTDLVAIGPSSQMAWLAGLNPHGDERPVMLLVGQTYAGLLLPALNADSVRQKTDLPFHTWRDEDGPDAALTDLLTACGANRTGVRVALDETMRTDFSLRLLAALPGARHSFTDATVGRLRAAKDDAEFGLLKASALLNDRAIMAGFAALRPGITETEVAEAINAIYVEGGAQAQFISVCFGPNGAFPHHHTGATRLADSMAVMIDAGARLNGYPSDMTRSGWFGTPDPEFLRVSAIVEQAVQAALAAARPGVAAATVDRAARDVITAAGYGAEFPHRTGHGLGLDIHEPPYITASSKGLLSIGNVFSIEPGVYIPGRFGIRLEDIVILRENGPEILSDLTRDLVILG